MDYLLEKIKSHANETELRYTRALLAEKEAREQDRRHAKRTIAALEREIKNLRRQVNDKRHRNTQEDGGQDADEWTFHDEKETEGPVRDPIEQMYRDNILYTPISPNVSPPRYSQHEIEQGLKTIHPSVL